MFITNNYKQIQKSYNLIQPNQINMNIIQQEKYEDQIENSNLTNAINCLTYGVSCLVYHKESFLTYECIMSIHQQYINILHIVVNRSGSCLLRLNEVKNIVENDYSVSNKLAQIGFQHCLAIYLESLQSIVFVFKTQSQKNIVLMGLQFFIKQAKFYYQKISQYDPFKAQSMMLFLVADADGGGLLDIKQILLILKQLNITKQKIQIQGDVLQINKYLYERQGLKKPKNAGDQQLVPLAFQYLLRYYSMKNQLAKYFNQYCPIFKIKHKNHKNTIIDIVKAYQKPIMSVVQLKKFYQQILFQNVSEQELEDLIKSFPVYDGMGQQKLEQTDLLSFNNFCNLIFSKKNSLILQKDQNMNLSLTDYYIYTDLSFKNTKSTQKNNYYDLAIKRGCKCIKILIQNGKTNPIIRIDEKQSINFDDLLRSIKANAFQKNQFPFFIIIQSACDKIQAQTAAGFIDEILGDNLYVLPPKYTQMQSLPSPAQLKFKILLISSSTYSKSQKQKQKQIQIPLILLKKLTILPVKLDFQRKNNNIWNCCFILLQTIMNYQSAEQQNICNYCKKMLSVCSTKTQQSLNYNTASLFRIGIHFAGLNFQVNHQNNYILHSKFLQASEGQRGYLQKPKWMNSKNSTPLYSKNFSKPLYKIKFNIVSGQKLIVNSIQTKSFYIQVYVNGSKNDEIMNKIFKSQPKTQGFYTSINLQTQFSIYCEQLATITINVKNQLNIVIASRSGCIKNMREGLRSVSLLGSRMQIGQNSYLLVFFKKIYEDVSKPNKLFQFLK